jgi:hypothetical protein
MTLMPAMVPAPTSTAAVCRRLKPRFVLTLILFISLLPAGYEAYRVVLGDNFHTVIPGQVYRCPQPFGDDLDRLITKYQICTVINLRGSCDPHPWYLDECRATHRHNVSQEDINFSAGRFPSVTELRHLVEVLDNTHYPILLHCRRGADRTGMASMIVLLLKGNATLAEARRQLGLRYGHFAYGRTASLDQFADFYENWLQATGKQHTPDTFRDWVGHHYCPGGCRSAIGLAAPPPEKVACDKSIVLRLRVCNTSMLAWRLSPLLTAGVHLGCHIYDAADRQVDVVKTGLRDGVVPVGKTVDFELVLPPLRLPGRYRLLLDMVDEQQCWFYQAGSKPLEWELIVGE